MGKKKIDNYVFLPGIGRGDNLFPIAYSLISQNIDFIKEETKAYINASVAADNAQNLAPNAVNLLTNNRQFIIDEIIAWIAYRVANNIAPFVGYTYSEASCRRDTGYIIDALIYDLRYGGNEKTIFIAENFWQGGVLQLLSPTQEIAGFQQVFDIITNFVLPKVAYTTQQSPVTTAQSLSGTVGETAAINRINNDLEPIIINVISGGLSSLPATVYSNFNYAGYLYDSSKCDRDIGFVLDAYLHDLRYGGNYKTRYISSRFWDGTTPQLSGDRLPEITAETFIRDLINNYILANLGYTTQQSPVIEAQVLGVSSGEAGAPARITSLANSFLAVLANGLTSLPTLQYGVSTIRLLGKYDLDDLLLITNAKTNQIIYNFGSSGLGATAEISTGYVSNDFYYDENFQSFRNTADYVTTLFLEADTSTASVTDDIQIFIENKETPMRPYDFGTDAIERFRVAMPQSMLDADFEYGLQPTKWAAIGLLRGYPSVYEIPGSDTAVVNVTTDASTGNPTSGVGASLITVTTVSAHGLTVGAPFTIKALANTITGFSRAEGTFLVNSVPSSITFTYYAVSKVGTSNGQVLATTYTQLRKAGFYTGANVGTPNFSVFSNGTTGSITTNFTTSLGSDQIVFTGIAPATGSPISGTGIPSGTQVAGVVGSGGVAVASVPILTAILGGVTSVDVTNTSGILPGMAIDNGSGAAIFVNGIVGSTVSFTGAITTARTGNTDTYSGVSGTTIAPAGTSATFTIERLDNVYSNLLITNPGSGYFVGDQILIDGINLGGSSGVNDATLTVTGVDLSNGITTATLTGTSIVATVSYPNYPQDATSGTGINTTWTVVRSDSSPGNLGIYNVTNVNSGSGFNPGDTITLLGTSFGGASPTNDIVITVDSVGGLQEVIAFSFIGTAVGTDATFAGLTGTNLPNSGASAVFTISRSAGSYSSASVSAGGSGYRVGNRITVLGTNLAGVSPANNATVTVTGVSGGAITTVSVSGTGISGDTLNFYSALTLNDITTASIPNGTTLNYSGIGVIEVGFSSAHGLVPGSSINVLISSTGTNHSLAAGPFYVEQIPSPTTFRYTCRTAGTVQIGVALTGTVYTRSDTYFIHRPYDGGVQLGTGGPQHGAQAIRMSKKYIRYQSGKGVNYCTGALFAPSVNIQSATATSTAIGSYITVVMDDVDHGLQVGGQIKLLGIETFGYNGTYVVQDIINERTFRVLSQTVLANVTATLSSNALMATYKWHGAVVRAGTFDDQNGLYFQYDGQTFGIARRSATGQLAGVVNIARDTNIMTGTNTRFRDQLTAGDRIVIKGMTHVVTQITSQTSMTVTPDYRGATNAVASKICKIEDFVVNQADFNIDRLDGTGPSGFNIDITKMQMIGMQWSWYAVGFVDFMLRGSDGNFIFFHRIRNSNVNTEAYMRSGNLPVRYEVQNESGKSKLLRSISANATTIPLVDASSFPNENGIVLIDNEIISFTGKSGNNLTGCTRGTSYVAFLGGAQRTFTAGTATTHEYNTGVVLISCTTSPIVSHWGSAFLMDGLFDEDRGYIFNYASTGISISTTKQTAFLIRLAPSVSNAIVGDLGDRELLNRAQLLLKGIAITSDTGTGGIVVEGVLNPSNYPTDPTQISWGGLSSVAAGGQPSFAQIAPGGSVTWSGTAQTTANATLSNDINGNLSVPNNSVFNVGSGNAFFYATQASWNTINATTGFLINDGKFPANTTISTITASPTPSATTLNTTTGNTNIYNGNFNSTFFAGSTQIWIQASSWQSLTNPVTAIGMRPSTTYFPSGTFVSAVSALQSAGGGSSNQYYILTMSQASTATLFPGNTLQFSLGGTYTTNLTNLYFTSSSWNALPIDARIVGNTTNDATTFPAQRTINTINTGRTFAGTSYVNVVFNGAASSISGGRSVTFTHTPYYLVSTSFASTSAVNAAATVQLTLRQNTANTNFIYLTQASWDSLVSSNSAGINTEVATSVTLTITNYIGNGTNLVTGTVPATAGVLSTGDSITISSATGSPQSSLNGTYTITVTGATTFTFTATSTITAGTYTTTLGTTVKNSRFPANTRVSAVSVLSTFASTTYYRITFNQTSTSPFPAGSLIAFTFGAPPYALPGETVFSFISQPGTSQDLDLSELKELTNTAIGGRGTYPNGPDVLAINVYKVSGTAVNSNIILRWGEAQA